MEKKKEVFTSWNWFILITCGFLTLMFLATSLLAGEYHGLVWAIVFLVGFISMFNKLKRSKQNKIV